MCSSDLRNVIDHFKANPPAVFIGIDSPDFNLGVELKLREAGIKTVHYVSPSVWAWRRRRILKIARAVDLMLALFPFEADVYDEHKVKVCVVGHPLADVIPLEPDRVHARGELNLPGSARVMALLPGSRVSEVSRLAVPFLQATERLMTQDPGLHVLVPIATPGCLAALEQHQVFQQLWQRSNFHVLNGQSRLAMEAADGVLLASGTATLEDRKSTRLNSSH